MWTCHHGCLAGENNFPNAGGKQPEIKGRRKKTASNTIFRHSDIVIVLSKEKCTILWRNVLCIVEEGVNTVEPKETQKCVLWIQITSFLYP